MVQQGRELQLPVLPCGFAHTLQPAWPAFPARCPVRVRLRRVLLGPRPSLRNLRWRLPAFVRLLRRYYAVVRLPATVHEGLAAHRVLPPARRTVLDGRPRGLPVLAHGVSPHAWGLRLRRVECGLALATAPVLPSARSDGVGARDQLDFGAEYPACGCPSPTLQVRPRDRPRRAGGQGGSLRLPCTTLSFATPCRFIPALSRASSTRTRPVPQQTQRDRCPHASR